MMDESRIRNLRYQVSEKMPLSYSDLLLLLDLANAQATEIERLRRDHAAAVNEANIAKARLKGVTKQWHADRAALEKSK